MNEFDFDIAQEKNVFQMFKNWKKVKTKRDIKKTKLKYEIRKQQLKNNLSKQTKYQISRKDLRKVYEKRKILKRLVISFMFLLIEKRLNAF